MITDFQSFGLVHIISLVLPVIAGIILIIIGLNAKTEKEKRNIRIILVILLILVRGSRYIIDIAVGRFEFYDLLSMQICHIDLILLIICLIKPNKALFHFVFLIGIPMGLAVALLPGKVHPEPGISRAILFIMSHMMLVISPIYLAIVEKMKLKLKYLIYVILIGNGLIAVSYFINKLLGTNFLYIMFAPEGTVIKKLDNIFGWPGYVFAMMIIAFTVMILVFCIYKIVEKICSYKKPA